MLCAGVGGMGMGAQRRWQPNRFDAGPSRARREGSGGSGAGSSPALVPSRALGERIHPGRGEVSSAFPPRGNPALSASPAATSRAGSFPRNGFSGSRDLGNSPELKELEREEREMPWEE